MYNSYDIDEKLFTIKELRDSALGYIKQQYFGRGGMFAAKMEGNVLIVFATRDEKLLPRGINGILVRLRIVHTGAFEKQ